MKSILFLLVTYFCVINSIYSQNCNCTHTVQKDEVYFDGRKKNVSPGDIICVLGSDKKYLQFKHIHGTESAPIVVINCTGIVKIENSDAGYGIKFDSSSFFHITGTGDPAFSRGFNIAGTGRDAAGLWIGGGSTDYEVDHLEISNTGFSGILAKTDPDCEENFVREKFVQNNTSIHHNYIHSTGGEGIYLGHSFYNGYYEKKCNKKLFPHQLKNVQVYENVIENTAWDGLQVGSATENVFVHNNTVRNYGLANISDQKSGIQIGEGTRGNFYSNVVENGKGNGVIVLGAGDLLIFNNVIAKAGEHGIFCDDRKSEKNKKIDFVNNSIISPARYGLKIKNDTNMINCYNNIIVLKTNDVNGFLNLDPKVKCNQEGNFFDVNFSKVQFTDDYMVKFIALERFKIYDISDYLKALEMQMEESKLKKNLGYLGRNKKS